MSRNSRFGRIRQQLEQAAISPGWPRLLFEFALFVFKQGWACLFGALMLAALMATHFWWPEDLPVYRYDALTMFAIAVQGAMLLFRLETLREASVILIFHVVGTIMEIFKTSAGSWVYPDPAFLRIAGVPLFSGFMYAAVGSYIARVWRGFNFRFSDYPPAWSTWLLATAIYANFFTHHWIVDLRWLLFAVTALLFWRTQVWFRPLDRFRAMPLLVGWLLVAAFIWMAENIGTFARAWTYPSQQGGWRLVGIEKLGSWYLLMIISFVLVSTVTRPIGPDRVSRAGTPRSPTATPVRQA